MDAVSLILTALSAGVTVGGQSVASEAIKDAYNELKTLIKRKVTGKPSTEIALKEFETDPETWEVPLKKGLLDEQVDQDKGIIKAAQKLMAQVDPKQAAAGRYNVQVTGNVQGLAQGDYQQVTMNFGNKQQEK